VTKAPNVKINTTGAKYFQILKELVRQVMLWGCAISSVLCEAHGSPRVVGLKSW
jgi:hypothetical protein